MSKLKSKFNTESLKSKFSDLLEGIDRNNTSKMIVEKYYGKLSSLELAEGKVTPQDAYSELLGRGVLQNQARHIVSASILSESKTSIADSYLLGRIDLLESAVKELKAYSWMPKVKSFISETEASLKENQTYILIESVIRDLEVDKNNSYYKIAIQKLQEASNSENPVFFITENLESENWIPLVKRLYEYAKNLKGSIVGVNPNFKVSKIYSPVEVIDESTFLFYSNGKMIEFKDGNIAESSLNPSDDFVALIRIAESAKIGNNEIRLYPNTNSILDIQFGEETKILLNNKLVESKNLESNLVSGGFVNYSDKNKLATIARAVSEGNKIKEIDFGYMVTSSVFEGLSVSVFNTNDKIFIQKNNKGMKENSLVEAENGTDAVRIVKDFMNFDITESVKALVENENTESRKKQAEINKIESRIKFILEKIEDVTSNEKVIGKSDILDKAKNLLESELKSQNDLLNVVKLKESETINESSELAPGQEYVYKGKPGYIYQGVTDGIHIFNQKDETDPTPLHMKEDEFQSALKAGEITK